MINDFVAQGYGMLTLGDHEVTRLNDVEPEANGTIACVGAGTGLGQCFLVADKNGEYQCYPSEGAKVHDFYNYTIIMIYNIYVYMLYYTI